ncbi:MAG: hypothetical protein LUE87_02745 [Lachnospiraceae bacterium]|nr:hypothetical protein [Lachnospiraceae bacterium]
MKVIQHSGGGRFGRASVQGRRFSAIMGAGFGIGCMLVILCRQKLLQDISLLDVDSLYLVRDSLIEGKAYFFYLLPRRAFVFGAFVLLWWYGVGSLGLKLGGFLMGMEAGIWLQACVEQYHLKGVLLWVFLYIPYIFFYLGAILCGLMFCQTAGDADVYEKRRAIRERPGFALAAAALFLAGLYLESAVHPAWLKNFLSVF